MLFALRFRALKLLTGRSRNKDFRAQALGVSPSTFARKLLPLCQRWVVRLCGSSSLLYLPSQQQATPPPAPSPALYQGSRAPSTRRWLAEVGRTMVCVVSRVDG
jgi:hypothetical protein